MAVATTLNRLKSSVLRKLHHFRAPPPLPHGSKPAPGPPLERCFHQFPITEAWKMSSFMPRSWTMNQAALVQLVQLVESLDVSTRNWPCEREKHRLKHDSLWRSVINHAQPASTMTNLHIMKIHYEEASLLTIMYREDWPWLTFIHHYSVITNEDSYQIVMNEALSSISVTHEWIMKINHE